MTPSILNLALAGRGAGGRGAGGGRAAPAGRSDPRQKTTMDIAAKDVGRLIGKSGATIRGIKEQTGAGITIGEEGDFKAEVIVLGDEETAANAIRMIEETLGYERRKTDAELEAEEAKRNEPIDWDALNVEYEANQKIRWAKLPKLIKELYKEHPEVTSMTQEDVDAFRKENNSIAVSNFDERSEAPLLNPAPEFRHCFEPYPDVMATIEKQAGQCATILDNEDKVPKLNKSCIHN